MTKLYDANGVLVETTPIDTTLTQSGQAADAKAVGDALKNMGTTGEIKGIVTSPSPEISYEVGYYIAQTDGHEVISFPSICMRNGDLVYYDGLRFHHVSSKGTFAPNRGGHYNVIIVGGGAAGMGTAINLIGTGMKVAVIEKNKHLGGTHTCAGITELCPSPVDDSLKEIVRTAWEDGYARFTTSKYAFGDADTDTFEKYWNGSHLNWISDTTATMTSSIGNKIALDKYWLQQYYYERLVSGGIDVYLDTEIVDAVSDGNYIRGVIDANGNVYNADFFVDASGVIIRKCGTLNTDYFYGYDGSARFGESKVLSANPNGNILNLPTLGFEQFSTPSETAVGPIPQIYAPFEQTVSGGMNKFETPRFGTAAKYATAAAWLEAHPNQNPGTTGAYLCRPVQHIGLDGLGIGPNELYTNGERKTYAKYKNKALRQNRTTVSFDYAEVNEMLGIREGCRLNALYMGTQDDCEKHLVELGDRLILSSWYYELHGGGSVTKPYFRMLTGLPITAMMSAKFKNYLNPSKDKGLSHYAHSTFRLTRTCWLSGRLSAEILKLVWQTTNDVSAVDVEAVKVNSGVDALFHQISAYIPAELIPASLVSISASYDGGTVVAGTDVNTLSGVTVQAAYSDGTMATVTDYTLSGTIGVGENTVTVTYKGLTTTFVVAGEEKTVTSISASYSGGEVLAGTGLDQLTGIVVQAVYSDGTVAQVTGYTLSGTIEVGDNTITVTYEGFTDTVTVPGYAISTGVPVTFELGSINKDTGEPEVKPARAVSGYFGVSGTTVVCDGSLVCSIPIDRYAFRAYDADFQFLGSISTTSTQMYYFAHNPITGALPEGTVYLRMVIHTANDVTLTQEALDGMTGCVTVNGVVIYGEEETDEPEEPAEPEEADTALTFEIGDVDRNTGEDSTVNVNRARSEFFPVSGETLTCSGTIWDSTVSGPHYYGFRAYDENYQFLGSIVTSSGGMFEGAVTSAVLPSGTAYLRMVVQAGTTAMTTDRISAMTNFTINGVTYDPVLAES